jgi:hypothetical protein
MKNQRGRRRKTFLRKNNPRLGVAIMCVDSFSITINKRKSL